MSEARAKSESRDYLLSKGSAFSQSWKVAAALGVVGAVGTFVGYSGNPERFSFSYLFAFMTFLMLSLGAIFFVLFQHLTGAHWGVTSRRTAEFFASAIPMMALLFLPVLTSIDDLYPWSGHGGAEHATILDTPKAHAKDVAHKEASHDKTHEDHGPAHAAHEALLAKKTAYLNENFFFLRALFYFLVWIWLGWRLFSSSVKQDENKDLDTTVRMQKSAAPSIVLMGLTMTFAAFDWLMSLEPSWYSTIFGVYLFANSAVAIFSTVIVVTLALRSAGVLGDTVNVEHYHDLGKMLFGFIVFWAYIGFSQLMLIWYAGIPEEATYYHHRWDGGGWQKLSMFLLIGHFVFPFLLIMSRNIKRRVSLLGFCAIWMLFVHVVEMYWYVMPYAPDGHFSPHWMDVACLLFVGGAYLSVVFYRMTRHPLVPVGDPRFSRCLHFENA